MPYSVAAFQDCSTDLIYFSSASENTHRFVAQLNRPASRIPLHTKQEPMLRATRPYVLVVPTYGGGNRAQAIPRQVRKFLNVPENRALLRGVITSGNTNFGEDFCIAGALIAEKTGVPELYHYELLGTPFDIERVNAGLAHFWSH